MMVRNLKSNTIKNLNLEVKSKDEEARITKEMLSSQNTQLKMRERELRRVKKRVKALEKSSSKEARLRIRDGGCEFHSYVKEPSFREKRRSVHPLSSIKEVAKSKE